MLSFLYARVVPEDKRRKSEVRSQRSYIGCHPGETLLNTLRSDCVYFIGHAKAKAVSRGKDVREGRGEVSQTHCIDIWYL